MKDPICVPKLISVILSNVFWFLYRESKGRSIWFLVHWLLGVTVSLLGIINIYTGLQSYYTRTMRSTSVWNLAFTVEIVVILFIYLLQEKWALYKANQERFSQWNSSYKRIKEHFQQMRKMNCHLCHHHSHYRWTKHLPFTNIEFFPTLSQF